MPAATAVIVFGSWLVLLGLTIWMGVRSGGEPRDGDE
jgi:hypothetical protein